MYLTLCKVADTSFHFQGDELDNVCVQTMTHLKQTVNYKLVVGHSSVTAASGLEVGFGVEFLRVQNSKWPQKYIFLN